MIGFKIKIAQYNRVKTKQITLLANNQLTKFTVYRNLNQLEVFQVQICGMKVIESRIQLCLCKKTKSLIKNMRKIDRNYQMKAFQVHI